MYPDGALKIFMKYTQNTYEYVNRLHSGHHSPAKYNATDLPASAVQLRGLPCLSCSVVPAKMHAVALEVSVNTR